MKIGHLVLVRLQETGNYRRLVPGIILSKFPSTNQFEVLVDGESWVVSPQEMSPIDMLQKKDTSEKIDSCDA